MNIELLKEKMANYFRTVTPEEIIFKYESMGAIIEDIPNEVVKVEFQRVVGEPAFYNEANSKWYNALLLEENPFVTLSDGIVEEFYGASFFPVAPVNSPQENTAYAMAA